MQNLTNWILYTRVIAFGNNPISALYDRSEGFFRRQMILVAKPVPKGRAADKHLTEKLLAEKEGIFLWYIEKLELLIANDFEFTVHSLFDTYVKNRSDSLFY